MRRFCIAILVITLVGCASSPVHISPERIDPITLQGHVDGSAKVSVVLGVARYGSGPWLFLLPGGIPVPGGAKPELGFGDPDQRAVARHLADELERLRVFDAIFFDTKKPADYDIVLTFNLTEKRGAAAVYYFDVELRIAQGEKALMRTRYAFEANSYANELIMGSGHGDAKIRAANALMERIERDLEDWVAHESESGSIATSSGD